jgi:hypothetical protein
MGTICDNLRKTGQLAATYFFSAFAGSVERKSKRGFVTTLAYRLQQCDGLDDRVSSAILTAVQKDPAVFRMSLEEQMEKLILGPLRGFQAQPNPGSGDRMVIIVDGVDECGEAWYINADQSSPDGSHQGGVPPAEENHVPQIQRRSRETDQIEVLSVLLKAIRTLHSPSVSSLPAVRRLGSVESSPNKLPRGSPKSSSTIDTVPTTTSGCSSNPSSPRFVDGMASILQRGLQRMS